MFSRLLVPFSSYKAQLGLSGIKKRKNTDNSYSEIIIIIRIAAASKRLTTGTIEYRKFAYYKRSSEPRQFV